MIKAIIIDDEPHCVTALQNDIKMFCPDVEVAEVCHSAKEGLLAIKNIHPQLVFLDVEMPWMNGFEMLEVLDKHINFQIIFTTAYDQFAARAFRVSAIDYLLKPIDGNDLVNAVEKAKKLMPAAGSNSNISNLLQNAKAAPAEQRIAVPNRNGFEFVHVSDILYCKADGAYTTIVLTNNRKLVLSKPLGETEQLLPAELFERAHHSVLVNIQHVNHFIKTNGSYLIMTNGDELNVAKSKKDHLLVRLGIK